MKKAIILLNILLVGYIVSGCSKNDNDNNPTPQATSFMIYALKIYDSNNNGHLDENEVANISELNISNKELTDLDGIEKFVNLEILNASNNNLSSVTLSNRILVDVNLSNNKLTQLDVSGCVYLTGGYAKFDATNNPNLSCIRVNITQYNEIARIYKANWKKDDTASFNITCN